MSNEKKVNKKCPVKTVYKATFLQCHYLPGRVDVDSSYNHYRRASDRNGTRTIIIDIINDTTIDSGVF